MRLGVLDIGSNTGHLLVVDAHVGAAPQAAYSHKQALRLAEHLDEEGRVTEAGAEALVAFTQEAVQLAEAKGCEEMLSFATSAVRDSTNADEVLAQVEERTGVALVVLAGEDEARLTFLAARRWFGWSAGRLAVFDIGGGSLEVAGGSEEVPDTACSIPLGAARLARQWCPDGALLDEGTVRALRREIRTQLARDAAHLLRPGSPTRAAATSKTFRSLARICGAAPRAEGPLVPRRLGYDVLAEWVPKLLTMQRAELASLPGVSQSRAHQVVPGALVAEAVMDIFELPELEICPWALREGVILDHFDRLSVLSGAHASRLGADQGR